MKIVHSLYLLRHAKSSWDDPSLADHERPLSPRGARGAHLMAAQLRGAVEPALVLCSTALRARQTLQALSLASEVYYEDGLYAAGATKLLGRLQRLADQIASAIVIGHNPGLQLLAVSLTGQGDPLLIARLREKLPTGALVKLVFQGPWASLAEGRATLEDLVFPREL